MCRESLKYKRFKQTQRGKKKGTVTCHSKLNLKCATEEHWYQKCILYTDQP